MYFWMLDPIFDGEQDEFRSNGYFSALFGTKNGFMAFWEKDT